LIIGDWGKFRMEFLRRFTPPDALHKTFKEFDNYAMSAKEERKSFGVKSHNDGFLEKMDRTLHAMDQSLTPGMEEYMMHRYMESLTPGVRSSVRAATATLSTPTLQGLMTVAVQVNPEATTVSLREEAESRFSSAEVNAHFGAKRDQFTKLSTRQFESRKQGLRCYACDSPDHLVSACDTPEGAAWRERSTLRWKERVEAREQSGAPSGADRKFARGRAQAKKAVAFAEPGQDSEFESEFDENEDSENA
jgi:hypothetical protein